MQGVALAGGVVVPVTNPPPKDLQPQQRWFLAPHGPPDVVA